VIEVAKIKWEMVRGKHIAVVPNMGVTLVAYSEGLRGIVSEVLVGSPSRPGSGELVAAWHSSGTIEDAKANCLRAFRTWAGSVELIATSDGRGNRIEIGTVPSIPIFQG
jgi:hypothetical protein